MLICGVIQVILDMVHAPPYTQMEYFQLYIISTIYYYSILKYLCPMMILYL